MSSFTVAANKFWTAYKQDTIIGLKLIDIYLGYIMITGILQFVYMVLVGTFPYNAFLAGFISTIGSFVLAVNLRIQTNAQNKEEFPTVSPERAFADFAFCSLLLHFFCVNYLG
ncbi:defender against death DAD protein [Hesseltinella vesiculosa]|uniref:Dolichyl-diphosphooligosaccharide--protein glycosyltransferase subunit OST2 n=1 Tax=Hesseltinella vesiculosa TaxID=101127 RepID=A0A1X2GI86_9FUNG|nr:defender against death DAD protein [Hesseltinella vesiculosa]